MPKSASAPITADGDQRFFAVNGHVLSQLSDLVTELKTIDEGSFSYHVNAVKNDFAAWVGTVLANKTLATKLKKAKTAAEMSAVFETGH